MFHKSIKSFGELFFLKTLKMNASPPYISYECVHEFLVIYDQSISANFDIISDKKMSVRDISPATQSPTLEF